MARLPELSDRDGVPASGHDAFDEIMESRKGVRGPFAILMHSPEVARRTAHLGAQLRFASTLPDLARELATITAARELDCDYEWAAHARLAAEHGVRREAIEALNEGAELTAFDDEEALVVGFVRDLIHDHRVPDDRFAAARERFGEQGVVELAATAGYYAMLAFSLNALEVMPPDDPNWPPALRDGSAGP